MQVIIHKTDIKILNKLNLLIHVRIIQSVQVTSIPLGAFNGLGNLLTLFVQSHVKIE